jgi:hypothetical protein
MATVQLFVTEQCPHCQQTDSIAVIDSITEKEVICAGCQCGFMLMDEPS